MEESYLSYAKRKSAEEYKAGKTTISGAAEQGGLTVWEMEQFLVSEGFRSQYSIEDLRSETKKTK